MGDKFEYVDHPLFGSFTYTPGTPKVDKAEGCEKPRRELTILSIRNQCHPNRGIRTTAYRHVDFCVAELKDR